MRQEAILLPAFSYVNIRIIHSGLHFNITKPRPDQSSRGFVLALPIFPGRLQPSIVGADELNFCVRNGNRWTLTAISTNSISSRTFVPDLVYLITLSLFRQW